jgi:hypothetical protein
VKPPPTLLRGRSQRHGAKLARELLDGRLDPGDLGLLCRACAEHTTAPPTGEPTLGVAWDADRLQLWRVGTVPNPRFLSTAAARDPGMIGRAASFHHAPHDWDELGRRPALQTHPSSRTG